MMARDAASRRSAALPDRTSKIETAAIFAVLCATAVAIIYNFSVNLEIRLAWEGFSPEHFLVIRRHPEWFVGNYPSGAEELLKSAPMLLYVVSDWINLSAVDTMKGMVAIEVTLIAAAAIWGVRQLRPESGWTVAALTALLLIAGRFAAADLGRWNYPTYGWVYSFAYAGAMVAVVAALKRRLLLAALALGFAVVSHVTLGLLAGLLVAAIVLSNVRSFSVRQLLVAAAGFGVTGGAWIIYILLNLDTSGGRIPSETFIAITRVLSAHWHPLGLGLLGDRHWERLFPFLSICLLIPVSCANAEGRFDRLEASALIGFAVVFIASFVGLLISEQSNQPFLIKLAIQRSSTLLLLVGALFVVPRLWNDVVGDNPIRGLLAALALVCPMLGARGVTIALALAICVAFLVEQAWRRQFRSAFFVVAAMVGAMLALYGFYRAAGLAAHWTDYVGWVSWPYGKSALVAVILLWAWLALRWQPLVGRIGLLCLIGGFAIVWSMALDTPSRADDKRQATNYLAAQRWARDNTPVGSLFIPNPVHFYGWREASARPSFGNVREWLYAGWIYNSSKAAFDEGWRRARSFGVDPDIYFAPAAAREPVSEERIYADFEARYKTIDASALSRLRAEFNARYFIVEKAVRNPPPGTTIVYENPDIAIVEIP